MTRATPDQFKLFQANARAAAGAAPTPEKKPRIKKRREDLPENQVADPIKGFLQAHGWRGYRMLAGCFRTIDGHRIVTGAQKDTPDYVFFRGAEYLFVEFKANGGQPTPNQAICIAQMRREGMPVEIANSYDRFVSAYLKRYPQEAVNKDG